MARKKKVRQFERKARGDKKFDRENALLIRNVAKENELAEWSHHSGDYVVNKITPELRELTKQKQQDIAALKRKKKPVSHWLMLENKIRHYDKVNKTQVWDALKVWIKQNPSVDALRGRNKVDAVAKAAAKMIKHMDIKLGLVSPYFPNKNDINTYGKTGPSASMKNLTKFQ